MGEGQPNPPLPSPFPSLEPRPWLGLLLYPGDVGLGRHGRIWDVISRLLHTGEEAYVVIVERGGSTGLRRIPLSSVAALKRGFMVLRDGTVIPLHRVVRVEAPDGRRIYSRGD